MIIDTCAVSCKLTHAPAQKLAIVTTTTTTTRKQGINGAFCLPDLLSTLPKHTLQMFAYHCGPSNTITEETN